MEKRLKKLVRKIKKIADSVNTGSSVCMYLNVKDLNELNQIGIAFKRNGFEVFPASSNQNIVDDAKYFCIRDDGVQLPISVKAYIHRDGERSTQVLNWVITEEDVIYLSKAIGMVY